MISSFLKATALGLSAAGLISLAGCNEVSREDVTAARDEAREEQREAEEARRNAEERIAEEERETEEVRREAFRPNYDDEATNAIQEEEKETAEVRREVADEVNEQQREANEAAEEAAKTEARFEARFEAQKARDSYVKDAELQLIKFDEQIAAMKEQNANLEGAEKEAADKKIELIEDRRDTAQEALDDVKSAEVMDWEAARDDVERALKDLTQALSEN